MKRPTVKELLVDAARLKAAHELDIQRLHLANAELSSVRKTMAMQATRERAIEEELKDERLKHAKATPRKRLSDERRSITRKFKVPTTGNDELRVYVTVGFYEDGKPGEIFIQSDKVGSLAHGAFDAAALAISIGLQYGVPLVAYTSKLAGMRFEPAGFTGDKEFPSCTSVLDLVARWLRKFEEA